MEGSYYISAICVCAAVNDVVFKQFNLAQGIEFRAFWSTIGWEVQTCQPPKHANLEVLKKSQEKPGDWDLKPGDFQNMC